MSLRVLFWFSHVSIFEKFRQRYIKLTLSCCGSNPLVGLYSLLGICISLDMQTVSASAITVGQWLVIFLGEEESNKFIFMFFRHDVQNP